MVVSRWLVMAGVLGLAVGVAAAELEGLGEARELKAMHKSAREAIAVAVRAKSDSVAWAAFGAYLRNTENLGSAEASRNIERFARRKDYLYRAALLVSLCAEWQQAADALAAGGKPSETVLAAAIYASAALGDYLGAQTADRCGPAPALAGQRKGKGGKQKAKARPDGALHVPHNLLQSRDADTRRLATLAAAYAADTEAEPVLAQAGGSRGPDAAVVFYLARMGKMCDDRHLADLVKRAGRIQKPVAAVVPALSRYTLDVPDACLLCEALGVLGQERYLPVVHQLLAHRDVRVQRDAACAIARLGSPLSVPHLFKALPTCTWPVLVAVCDALGRMPAAHAVVPLIERLRKEKGRMRLDLVYALSSIAGAQEGETAEEWRAWWNKQGGDFQVDAAASATYRRDTRLQDVRVPGNGFFYGLTIFSDRFCYVVDSSLSMKGGRIASLKDNMTGSIKELKPHVMYNIVNFGGDVVVMYPRALTDSKRTGISHVAGMIMTYATRSYDSIERGCLLPGLDTVYFLSDGAPVHGQTDDWQTIMRALQMINRYRPVAVFGIDFDPSARNQKAMKRMAHENYGRHESVEVGG